MVNISRRAALVRGVRTAAWGSLIASGISRAARASNSVYEVVSEPTLLPGAPIPSLQGPVVLRINGRIASAGDVEFDMSTLERLGLIRFTTPTSWTPGPVTFEGVLLSRLLDFVGVKPDATTLMITAIDDYKAPVPVEDAHKWPVMLAVKENGAYMSVRDHGPLWVVYPQHAYPEVGERDFLSRWVWQVAQIAVE